jgi:hypothetical protein
MILFFAPVLILALICFLSSGYGVSCCRLTFLPCFSCGSLIRRGLRLEQEEVHVGQNHESVTLNDVGPAVLFIVVFGKLGGETMTRSQARSD